MIRSLPCASALVCCALVAGACRRADVPPPDVPSAAPTRGTIAVSGLHAPVTVGRDGWGIPHITASDDDDLFFAQGFVQAQDRLFQMDLWRRAVQGRLAEVLGANFIDRDAMTRRVQFRGDIAREWASYGPDSRRIAVAFTRGINAWVARAREALPEEFVLAGWTPEFWKPEDLLNRTDAYLASGSAQTDLLRARLVPVLGPGRVARLLPVAGGAPSAPDPAVDLSAITYVVPETLRMIGTRPFFLTLAAQPSAAPRPGHATAAARVAGAVSAAAPAGSDDLGLPQPLGQAWAIDGSRSASTAPLLAVQSVHPFTIPAPRYLVHLTAPGLNVAGLTAPWLPGVAVGHNDQMAWAMTSAAADTQDLFVERLNPADHRQVDRAGRWVDMAADHERIDVKGRARPFEFDRLYTSNGVVIAIDRERHLVYTLRWSGAEPGGAAELAAPAIDRARSVEAFVDAASRWHMPVARFVFAGVDGRIGQLRAGLVPSRAPRAGALVGAGWTAPASWPGWMDDVVREPDAAPGIVVADSGSRWRVARLTAAMTRPGRRTLDDMQAAQDDVVNAAAARLLPLLAAARGVPSRLAAVRERLVAWDGSMTADAPEARLYTAWEAAVRRQLAARIAPSEFVSELAAHLDLVSLLTTPAPEWFGAAPAAARDALLVEALAAAHARVGPGADTPAPARALFEHPLGVFDAGRRRFTVGPFPRPGSHDTLFATNRAAGPTVRAIFDLADWDRALVMLAPGESGSPASAHYEDLAGRWAARAYVPLVFSAEAVRAAITDTLVLQPAN